MSLCGGHRVIIPSKFRDPLLRKIHVSHLGVVKSKALARSYFWWPGLEKSIEQIISNCDACRTNQPNPPKVDVIQWPKSNRLFERIHI